MTSSAACGRVFAYPEATAEQGAELCADGADNDFDAFVDCKDSDCDGFCPELEVADCIDGRDNDGDGLADARDPRCWVHSAPSAERCAELPGIELSENFEQDATLNTYGARWWQQGVWHTESGIGQIAQLLPHLHPRSDARHDPALGFAFNKTASDLLDEDNLGTYTNQLAFSGAWLGSELSFSASVPAHSLLRAALVPVGLAPVSASPQAGAASTLLAVTIDAARSPATFALDVEESRVSTELPFTSELCADLVVCPETLGTVHVWFDGDAVQATFTLPGGAEHRLRAKPPSSETLPTARLVLWGGSTRAETFAVIDDLRVSVPPLWPCGFAVPQIPDTSCEFSGKRAAFGQRVSIARGANGEYCALVTASADSSTPPDTVTAWRSPDGAAFSPASTLDAPPFVLPEGAELLGASIAPHGEGFRALVTYRGEAGVELAFVEADGCDAWAEPEPGPKLFDDAEAPSLVLEGAESDLYFTRPPTEVAGRTLWRLRAGASDEAFELLAQLDPAVGAPVSIARAGSADLVLTYPAPAGSTTRGVGVLVANESRRQWQSVGEGLELELPPPLDRADGRQAFDDLGVAAAALAWDAERGVLLYSATSVQSWYSTSELPAFATGTARLLPVGSELGAAPTVPEPRCGNGNCDPDETCTSCRDECPCGGVELLTDVFSDERRWHISSLALDPSTIRYFFEDGLNLSGGEPTWSELPLDRALTGDFELSFDAELAFVYPDDRKFCAFHVGLGSAPELSPEPGSDQREARGIFARLRYSTFCGQKYALTPFIANGSTKLTNYEESVDSFPSCYEDWYARHDRPTHVVLRRDGGKVRVTTPRLDGCGLREQTLEYAGAIESLESVLIGFGGAPFESCAENSGSVRITNLELRLPDDPEDCPNGKELCAKDGAEPSCVDTRASPENCGGCGRVCDAGEACDGGKCRCSDRPGILECDGVCVDSLTSVEHCGSCGHACSERCVQGACDVIVGDCVSPFPLPPEGDTLELDFSEGEQSFNVLCGESLRGPIVVAWTPARSGTAVIEADVGDGELDTVLGVTEDSCCCHWYSCNDDALDLGLGSRTLLPVQAGILYRIGVGARGIGEESKVTLRVGFE